MYGAGKSRSPEMMRPDVEMSDVRLTSAHDEQSDGEHLSPSRLHGDVDVTERFSNLTALLSLLLGTTSPSAGGLTRARLDAYEGGFRARIRAWLGLSRAESDRAVRCVQTSVALNAALALVLVGLVASMVSRAPETSLGDGDGRGSVPARPETHVRTQLGAVAADEPRCSAVGADALADGGSAVDAAVAAALCLGVTHPHSSGVGGGAFMVVYSNNGSSEVLEFRERAPNAASREMFANVSNVSTGDGSASVVENASRARPSEVGGAAAAVPAELHGLRLAWERHGVLPWSRLVEPAAALADGFAVGPELARAIAENADALRRFPATKAVFLHADGSPLREGDVCRNEALARTLRRVASEGPSVLRSGALAEALARDIRDAGGVMTAEDLASYEPRVLEPLRADALGYTVLGVPPPSSGGAAVAQILEFVSGFAKPLASAPDGALGTHRLVEAFKHAFAMRMNLGDPEVPPPPGVVSNISGAVHDMLSPAFNAALRAMTLDDATLPLGEYGARWNLVEDHGTTHVSVVDSSRNAVAMTSTINTAFGSKVVSPSTGILLNNEMDDFSVPGEPNHYGLAPSAANFIAPGRAPLSSMSPTVVLDGSVDPPRVVAVLGASGGPRIITAVAQVLLNVLALNMSPLDAVDAPRVHHQLVPDVVFAENVSATVGDGAPRRVDDATAAALRKRGHVVEFSDTKTAVAQLIVVDRDTDLVHAVSDARKGGAPAAQDRDRDEEQRRRRR